MKYMLIMRSTDEAFEAFANIEFEEIMNTMGKFNDEWSGPACCSPPRASTRPSRAWSSTSPARRPS